MASLKLPFSPDNNPFESKKLISALYSSNFASSSLFSGYVCTSGAIYVKPFCKLKHYRVARLKDEPSNTSEANSDGILTDSRRNVADEGNLTTESQDFLDKGRVNTWRRSRGAKRVRGSTKSSSSVYKNVSRYKKRESSMDDLDFDSIRPELSSRQCNLILQQLERSDDSKALRFFEWMKVNGKLRRNSPACNLILRVLGRKSDWDGAEALVKEMVSDLDCELTFRVFNTLIYACYKSGLVGWGSRWFRMMLDYNVEPNVATFGMLMSLYQKCSVVEEAEYTYSLMRDRKITCQSAYSAMITIYTRMGLYEKAEIAIGFLREDRVVLNRENWLVVLNAYCQQGKLRVAERVFCEMSEARFLPCLVAYNTMITGYGRISEMDCAETSFRKLTEIGFVPNETTYRSLIEGWGRAGNYEKVKFYYNELKRLGFEPYSSNLNTLIRLQAMHEDEEGAVKTIDDMMMIGCQKSSIFGIVLQAYEKANRLEKMALVLEGPLYDHVLINQTSCTILVTAYVKNCLIDKAIKVLTEKKWVDPMFEENLYHLLICSCKDWGRLENAIRIFTSMPKPAKPNLGIYCTMIDIYSKTGVFSEAEMLYARLKASGVKMDMIAFSIVIRMYVKSGALKEASKVLEIMDEQKNIVPDVYLLRDMFRIYQQLGMDDKLSNLYYKVLKNGEIWDEEMYNCVINCCARALPVDELTRLFDEMISRGFSPNTFTFNVVLNAYGKSKLFEKAKRVFGMARKRGLIDVISYNTIIAAYGRNKYVKNMSSAIKKMQFDGFSVSVEAYNCMLDAYGKQGEMDKFKSVLQMMKASNCSPDNYTYNILINIYGQQGLIEEVGGVLMELKECGVSPDLCSYNTLIKAYGIAGLVQDAVDLVKEMRENQVEPDKITYHNLISALKRNDMFLEAVKWSLWMKQMGF
ncbi:Pentatricopeptide repeat-containing protein -chloroplastic [Striga hermonthica]|uniref:Pentatricopeptide repeat-containing protein -chloroplastic n=1 Tax=Striga hermonthica TaxID=68872 RepID=A0A9N7RBH5_STRHE|nr:Pentatricopeptide repeat-containing protein -chloroplastic [Striga hermonthica]